MSCRRSTALTFDAAFLLDLGISSHQVDEFERGFTFRPGARLDMRMSSSGATAADLLNDADEEILESAFKLFGDEPRARGLAREVVRRRETIPFTTSDELVGAIRAVLEIEVGRRRFCATLSQAVRIAVNDELPGLTRSSAGVARSFDARREAVGCDHISFRRRSHCEKLFPRVERGVHLSAEAPDLHLSRTCARHYSDATRSRSVGR